MFRTGGSAGTGITSGLAPRQGYDIGGLTDSDIAEIRKQSRELTQGNRRADMNQFLIDFGLNLVSGTPKSNIFATAAEEAEGAGAGLGGRGAGVADDQDHGGSAGSVGEAGGLLDEVPDPSGRSGGEEGRNLEGEAGVGAEAEEAGRARAKVGAARRRVRRRGLERVHQGGGHTHRGRRSVRRAH